MTSDPECVVAVGRLHVQSIYGINMFKTEIFKKAERFY